MKYVFSYFRDEPRIVVERFFFGLLKQKKVVVAPNRYTYILDMTHQEQVRLFQGDNWRNIISKIIGGTMYQLEYGPLPTPYIPTTNSPVTRAEKTKIYSSEFSATASVEPAATNLCYPSEQKP